jgi:hypothetical protein
MVARPRRLHRLTAATVDMVVTDSVVTMDMAPRYGGGSGYGSTGMRQRKAAHTTEIDMQVQIQERQQKRQTQSRLESARQAEKSLAELSTLFGKMSTLIVQQGEVLEKVEDDVEAALGDVTAGEQEVQTLYKIKKGNRALILKVFGILIFFILFMRLY